MEEFLISNAERYRSLVQKAKLAPPRPTPGGASASRDIIVSARIRPLSAEESAAGFPEALFPRAGTAAALDAHELRRAVRGPPVLKTSTYQVDRLYDSECATEAVYADVFQHLVPWAWGGGIGTLFAYGQTGSGKTFTVGGLERLVAASLMDGELDGERSIYVTVVELAGNAAFDLLNSRRPVSVLEDAFGVTQLAGAQEHRVRSADEMLGLLATAAEFRRTQATRKNDTSSRSHAICRVRIAVRIAAPAMAAADDGILYLVDLAGSEAARDRAGHSADRVRESRDINTSLSVLKDCIRGKTEADARAPGGKARPPHVPFRQSALTKVLKHVFDPAGTRACRTLVVACVNPCLADIAASRNTLRYAEMLRVFVPPPGAVAYSPEAPATWTNEQLRAWIEGSSGAPPVSSAVLAPHESGLQILRLPAPEFERRCLKTPGVTREQATAVRAKLWHMHVDAQQRATAAGQAGSAPPPLGFLSAADRSSSADPAPAAAAVPFKERIRPGMVVSWTPPPRAAPDLPDGVKPAVVLCPAAAAGHHALDVRGRRVDVQDGGHVAEGEGGGPARFLCALVHPGVTHGTYEVQMWRHMVIDVDMMDAEVTLEYDPATRYYYIAV
ncbi:Kinesin-like protein KIF2C [Tolypocladium ophioglossoides CBS 100239]|uniref:Kinesin-like protein KIF2C n=1 Tax=Tolypocladium ophioglossoides (strain CBS 100239) TaxID=1163406 RepID=A0A0L0MXJ9_TOLOC|nr:Kinesin-like protein KIF2C [Tolypocladium ophioglossoides CBS 100239]